MSNVETTYVMAKPDAVQRQLVGKIISKFEKRGLQLVGLKMQQATKEIAEAHYAEHKERPFFPSLTNFLTSGPVVAMAWKGPNAIAAGRQILGKTNSLQAEMGSLRATYSSSVGFNCVHASDGKEAAATELGLWFKDGEICAWEPAIKSWVYE